MARLGRPATGHKPVVSIRMDPAALRTAKQQAKATGKALGTWLEEALKEKMERERAKGNDG